MASLKELIARKSALDKQIAEARQREVKEAIANVRAIVAEFELTAADVFPKAGSKPKRAARRATSAPAPARYRDPVSGKTWSGRGRAPNWIAGKERAEFEIR
ncbi:H-NS family nucleoid-associated regulatory protein [Quisquiliibacterium transsilvanicum]|jgi:DNA-binding protein H-NS|uniref:DNA-binding protein H-NS n=1 Tax=Quisquiliibacterium transsilvanicum TaxID=1549638 RepID=A0A7W8M7Y5_9BURK|nr:H-NS histone family protein [Quisquiliibacterium transsilvanicum]MBB5270685.1 DNA-binding protein H-NS [Quisquiliibacterium transsilvanicum]